MVDRATAAGPFCNALILSVTLPGGIFGTLLRDNCVDWARLNDSTGREKRSMLNESGKS